MELGLDGPTHELTLTALQLSKYIVKQLHNWFIRVALIIIQLSNDPFLKQPNNQNENYLIPSL